MSPLLRDLLSDASSHAVSETNLSPTGDGVAKDGCSVTTTIRTTTDTAEIVLPDVKARTFRILLVSFH